MTRQDAFRQGLSTGLRAPSGKGGRLIILHAGSADGFVDGAALVFRAKKGAFPGRCHRERYGAGSNSKRIQQRAHQISATYPSGQWLLTLFHQHSVTPAQYERGVTHRRAELKRAAPVQCSLAGVPQSREALLEDTGRVRTAELHPSPPSGLQCDTMDALLRTVACILMLTYYPARTAQKSSLRAKESEAFDLCEEKFKVVQMAKGARLGAKMLDSCAMMLISRYGPKAIGIQRAAVKICMGFRMCHAKYADIKVSDKTLTVT
ncbi:hypothetical protein HPB52_021935 [Rhipicephalus sanguineus]|uniref:Uncharacterized protein n=1 Tax=Rhipicephalus sanguineus TaxID=34632 RepID=A0A9D4QG76_RHISA|nr:hypothetical protein HPB52_021935 [Rhipicephalus sanguineus]